MGSTKIQSSQNEENDIREEMMQNDNFFFAFYELPFTFVVYI